MPIDTCPLCLKPAEVTGFDLGRKFEVKCSHCVNHTITKTVIDRVREDDEKLRRQLQQAAREKNTGDNGADGLCLIYGADNGEIQCSSVSELEAAEAS